MAVNLAVNSLETMMLREISLIVSGRRSSFESFENAKEMQKAIANLGTPGNRAGSPLFK